MEDFGEADIVASAGLHDFAVLAEDAAEGDVAEVAVDAHFFGGGEELLEVEGLGRADDIPDGIGVPAIHAVGDGGEVGGGVEESAVGLADDGGFF